MQDYQSLKQYWLDLLIKSNLQEKKVWIVPKNGKTKPHWRTIRVRGDEPQTNPKMKKQDDESKGRIKKPEENSRLRTKKLEDTSNSKNKEQDNKNTRGVTQDASNTAPAKSNIQQGQKHWNTMKMPKAIKQASASHRAKFDSKDEFFKDLKDKGITWNEHSHEGINYMRAMMALNAAIMNESHGFKSPFSESTESTSDTQQDSKSVKDTPKDTSKIKTPTGRLSTESKAKTHEFFMSCADRDEFYTKLKQLGVKWTENDHPAINLMRAKMALSLKIENGFDPNNPPSTDEVIAQQNGINVVSSTETTTDKVDEVKTSAATEGNKLESKTEQDDTANQEPSKTEQEDNYTKQDGQTNANVTSSTENKESSTQKVRNKENKESNESAETSNESAETFTSLRNYDSVLAKKLGKELYDSMRDHLEKCEDTNLIKLWSSYEDKMKIVFNGTKKTAYYHPFEKEIAIANADIVKGTSRMPPHIALFHEAGHLIDYHSGGNDGMSIISKTYKDGALIKAIRSDVDNLLKSLGFDVAKEVGNFKDLRRERQELRNQYEAKILERYKRGNKDDREWFYNQGILQENYASAKEMKAALRALHKDKGGSWSFNVALELVDNDEEVKSNSDRFNEVTQNIKEKISKRTDDILVNRGLRLVEDLISGASHGFLLPSKGNHHPSYWDSADKMLATEAFAELTESFLSSPKTINVIKKHMPNTCKMYSEIIEALVKEGENKNE